MCFTIDICPDLLLAGIAAAAAAAFVFLYQQITLKGRRKKRAMDSESFEFLPFHDELFDWLTVGRSFSTTYLSYSKTWISLGL